MSWLTRTSEAVAYQQDQTDHAHRCSQEVTYNGGIADDQIDRWKDLHFSVTRDEDEFHKEFESLAPLSKARDLSQRQPPPIPLLEFPISISNSASPLAISHLYW